MARLLMTCLVFLGVFTGIAADSRGDAIAAVQDATFKPTCEGSLQTMINAAAPGERLEVRGDCVYREQVFVTKPLRLDGQGAAEIRGSDVWTEWNEASGLWVSELTVPPFYSHGDCAQQSDGRCLWPEQVFLNSTPLRQVATGLTPMPGQFALDSDRRIVLADDPNGAHVEVTTRDRWMTLSGTDITVRGFVMLHAAADSQTGGLDILGATNWVVENCDLSYAHGANLYMRDAHGGALLENELHHGGQLGLGGHSTSITIRGNSIHNNNTEGFSVGWEAGGMKITNSDGVVIEGNEVGFNRGTGIWCDIDCLEVTIRENQVHHNTGIGIMFEISDGAEIYGNRVWENGHDPDAGGWVYDAGILVASSRNALVYDNIVAWNGDGIAVISQCRDYLEDGVTCNMEHPWNSVYGNEVYDNVIVMWAQQETNVFALAWLTDIVDASGAPYGSPFTLESENRGYGNAYWIPSSEPGSYVQFGWSRETYTELDAFNETPGEDEGVHLDDAERDRILVEAGIPVEPILAE